MARMGPAYLLNARTYLPMRSPHGWWVLPRGSVVYSLTTPGVDFGSETLISLRNLLEVQNLNSFPGLAESKSLICFHRSPGDEYAHGNVRGAKVQIGFECVPQMFINWKPGPHCSNVKVGEASRSMACWEVKR